MASGASAVTGSGPPLRSGWWTPRAVALHAALVAFVPLFLVLGLWQVSRALDGNVLSWAYTFEWPFFACYATWMWWKLVHEEVARCAVAGLPELESEATGQSSPGPQAGDAQAVVRVTGTIRAAEGSEPAVLPAAGTGATAGDGGVPPAEAATAARLGWNPYDDEADPELAAYNRYLASLHSDDHPSGHARRTGQRRA